MSQFKALSLTGKFLVIFSMVIILVGVIGIKEYFNVTGIVENIINSNTAFVDRSKLLEQKLSEGKINPKDAVTELSKMQSKFSEQLTSSLTREKSNAATLLLIYLGLIAVIAYVGYKIYNKYLIDPILQLLNQSKRIVDGEANVVVNIDSEDETGELGRTFNIMSEKITQCLSHLKNLPTPVMLIDNNFNIQYMNDFGAELLNSTPEDLVGKKCYDHFKTDHCNTEKCACNQAMKFEKTVGEETVSHAGGGNLPIMYTGAPIKDNNGKVVGALEYVADISEVKNMQSYLERCTKVILAEMDKLADGDLTVRLNPEKNDDDIAKLFNGFNNTVTKIRETLNNVVNAVEATASASEQISSSTEELAAGAQEQSTQSSEIAGAVEEMTASILQNSQNTSNVSTLANEANNFAISGGNVVKASIEGINKIAEVVEDAALNISKLGTSSEQIGEIVQVINDIADQTNLLALNAAIEAARAGEQGRGFAVVADEVRKLAERTTKATKEIADMIKTIQTDTILAVKSIERGNEKVSEGKNLVLKAGDSLHSIVESTVKVQEEIVQVASATEEQSSAAEQISRSIEGISAVANQSAEGTQQIAMAAEDLNKLTRNLEELVATFKIRENDYTRNKIKGDDPHLLMTDYNFSEQVNDNRY